MGKKESLIQIVGRENVLDDAETLQEYSGDRSFVPPGRPWCVARVATSQQVQEVVQWANAASEPLTPVSSPGGPRARGDTVPSRGGVVVDLSRMNQVRVIDRRDRVAMVEPGVTFDALEIELRKHGLRALKPLLPRGTKSVLTSYLEREPIVVPRERWDTIDPLICVEGVSGTGDVFRTGSAAGPGTVEEQIKAGRSLNNDVSPGASTLSRIMQGAQGTLGIVTWATVVCGAVPALAKPFFVASQTLEPLIELTYRLTRDRMGEEVLLLNRPNLAAILAQTAGDVADLRARLPEWVLFFNLTAPDYFPEENLACQEDDTREFARQAGLDLASELGGVGAAAFQELLDHPPADPFKLRARGGNEDLFFLTTLDRTPTYVEQLRREARAAGYPLEDVGIYLQPTVQGCSCHCELSFPFAPENAGEREVVRSLSTEGARRLAEAGAFFSRPYGPWAGFVFERDPGSAASMKKLKGIFDPNGILNPGKLGC